jgi:DNA-binding NarL/FixJ family response regulator
VTGQGAGAQPPGVTTSARDAARETATAALLDAVVTGRVPSWQDGARIGSDPDWDGGLEVLALVLGLRWQEAGCLADALPAVPSDDQDAWWLRRAAALWAASGDPGPTSPLEAGVDGGPSCRTPMGRLAAHLMVEAVLAHARLDLATDLAARYAAALTEPLVLDGEPHPFGAMTGVCRARVLAFGGDVAAAGEVLGSLPEPSDGPLKAVLAGTTALVRGNDADPARVRRSVAEVDRFASEPDDHLGAGAQLLAAFGEVALGDVAAAARRVLVAGGDADLARLNVADRALGLEMLVALAVADGDLDAAEAWADRIVALLGSPIADSTTLRALSRVALLAGRVDEAIAWGERAVARAREAHRLIEYAEGEIVLNRARLEHSGTSGSDAARALGAMVAESERRGHRMARRAAARELKAAGRRLPPVAGSGWAGLTTREAEVARLVAGGTSNADVAARLHLSAHTVHAHVSRVLAAFAVPTRSALPGAMADVTGPTDASGARPPLTARQAQVAALVARGLPNARVADELGVSGRTVERHVSDILQRWRLGSRTALARAWLDT